MKLLLTSNGLCNDSIRNALREMLDKPTEQAKIVFVPTGADPVRGDKTWLIDDISRAKSMGWKSFDVVNIAVVASWPRELWWSTFTDADVIMFCGGHAQYLSYWLGKSGLLQALPGMLHDKVYIGISAGSMVATSSLATSSLRLAKYTDGQDGDSKQAPEDQSSEDTVGLTDFLFRPHLNSPYFPLIREDFMRKVAADLQTPIYVADDETAVRVIDGKVDVISEGKWLLL
jgi:dipeptidase E